MVAISRRSFIEKVGLGIGAGFLSPIANVLVNEARGDVADRKIAYFFLVANGIHPLWNFTPPEFMGAADAGGNQPVLDGPTQFTWPTMFAPLEPYRNRMVLMDGLYNQNRVGGDGGHSMRFGALSCTPSGNGLNPEAGTPGGITIDQLIANKIGVGTPRKSVLIGISTKPEPLYASVFASGRDRAEPQIQSPSMLFNDIFGTRVADASGINRGAAKQRLLFDTLRTDITRLQGSFAPAERRKLDIYLSIMEDFELRQKALAALSCPAVTVPSMANEVTPEDKLESLHSLATLALACGVTNVVGVALGCGFSHDTFPELKKILVGTPHETTRWEGQWSGLGHMGKDLRKPLLDYVYQWNGRMIAQTIETLTKVKVGNGNLMDKTLMMYSSENAEDHHASHTRWPLALIGNAGGKLKIDGRFIRFPARKNSGSRPMNDLFCSLATAFGIPTNDFGKGGNEIPKGPLEILTA